MTLLPLRFQNSNPFYFLSAACMLGGCLLVSNSRSWASATMPRDLTLIATLNVYEAVLIALAWYLVRRRRLIHDGMMLVVLEAFFLVDVTFLNAEIVTSNFTFGLFLNIILLLAAVAKLACLARIAGLPLRDGRFVAVTIQLAALFTIPILFRRFDGGDLPAGFFYAAWWAAGLLIPLCCAFSRRPDATRPQPFMPGIVRLLCILPWLSFLLHLGILHYVYNVTFYAAELAPILLGLACLMRNLPPSRFINRRDLLTLQCLLPAAAILVSLANPAALHISIGKHNSFDLTPAHLAVAGAYLTIIYCLLRPYAIQFLATGTAAALAFIFGPSTQQLDDWITNASIRTSNAFWSLIPKTALSAGITAIAAAFAFLGLGALVSLRRPPVQPPDPNAPQP